MITSQEKVDPDTQALCHSFTIHLYLTLVLLNKLRSIPTSNFQPIRLIDPGCQYKFTYFVTNSEDPDQLASSEANISGSALFAKAGHIQVQQDKE